MDIDAIHLVFGTGGEAPAWFAQALAAHGSIDSSRVQGVWVHQGAYHADDFPESPDEIDWDAR